MEEDELQGLVPFFVSTTLGTTGSCAFDALEEIGAGIHQRFPGVWLHVDAAYAGNAFICPELKPLLKVSPEPGMTSNWTEKYFTPALFHGRSSFLKHIRTLLTDMLDC